MRTTEEATDESNHLVEAASERCELREDRLDSGDREEEVEGAEREGDVSEDDIDLVGDGLLDVGDGGCDVAIDGDADGESLASTESVPRLEDVKEGEGRTTSSPFAVPDSSGRDPPTPCVNPTGTFSDSPPGF